MNRISDENGVTFDYVHYCMHWGINGEMYERYAQLYNGPPGAYNNYGDNRNLEISVLLARLDTAPYGSAEERAIANEVQWLVGEWCNPIATAGHPDWYLYKETYWARWPNQLHKFLPASPYGGSAQVANLHFILLALGANIVGTSVPAYPAGIMDINNDGKVDIVDLRTAGAAFLSEPCKPRWDFTCDVAGVTIKTIEGYPGYPKEYRGSGKVDIEDLRNIAAAFLKTWKFDP
jgi:hypothetical protein